MSRCLSAISGFVQFVQHRHSTFLEVIVLLKQDVPFSCDKRSRYKQVKT